MTQPFEVVYTTIGKKRKRKRSVIVVLCPTALAQSISKTEPIFVDLGDILVDWGAPYSAGYKAMFMQTPAGA